MRVDSIRKGGLCVFTMKESSQRVVIRSDLDEELSHAF